MTITGTNEDLDLLMEGEFKGVPDWALMIKARGRGGGFGPEAPDGGAIRFKLWSRWAPDFDWLASLLTKYPSCWVKNEWSEEGGMAGVWIGTGASEARRGTGEPLIERFEWDDMCIEEECARFKNS